MRCEPKESATEKFNTWRIKKDDIYHYGYKNSICINAEHSFIRRLVVTPAKIYDVYVWADSAYSGCFKDLLSLAGFEKRIHEKG